MELNRGQLVAKEEMATAQQRVQVALVQMTLLTSTITRS